MKAITPIISIIILLLITVGLAAAAWTYMDNYLRTLTAKNIEVSTQKCITIASTNKDVMAIVHSMGTSAINTANDVTIMDEAGNPASGTWTDLDGNPLTNDEIEAGKYAKVTIDCCTNDCPKTCTFGLVVAGRMQNLAVYCP